MVKTLSRIPRGTTGAIRLNLWSQYRAWRYASAIFIWLPAGLLLVALAVLRSQDNTGRSGLLLFDDKSSPCYDKHYLADFVRSDEDRDRCINMPAWSEISKLYGDEPRIIGLETCQRYREMLAEANRSVAAPVYPMPRVAGLQNTGTTAFADTLFFNLAHNPTIRSYNPRVYNVPWRKHTPEHYRFNVTSDSYGWNENKEHVLPVLLVRDPYRWLGSMEKIPYRVVWKHSAHHAPNLVRYPGKDENMPSPTPVQLYLAEDNLPQTENYKSLTHMWSDWYREYLDAPYPRLIIRFEDTLYHAEKIFRAVSDCAGVPPVKTKFARMIHSAKSAKEQSSDLLTNLAKNGVETNRYVQMIKEDLDFARATLDPHLMTIFGYVHPEGLPEGSYAELDWINRTNNQT